MPELSPDQRHKATEIDPAFASRRLIEAVELGWEITFRCLACGAEGTWRQDVCLGRAKALLGLTMLEVQRRVVCPRCSGTMPRMVFSGVLDPGEPEKRRSDLIMSLLNAGLVPSRYGIGEASPVRHGR